MKIDYFDTTMRDGAQSLPEGNQFPNGLKPEIAEAIASLGIHTIEAGFPATPYDAEEVQEVARTVGKEIFQIEPTVTDSQVGRQIVGTVFEHTPVITGLSRSVQSDIEKTWQSVYMFLPPRTMLT